VRLDQLPLRSSATVSTIDWAAMAPGEARRLRELGFDEGVKVQALHVGPFGRDPIACRVGRMTIALRRANAAAIHVENGHAEDKQSA
jgi:ferrous iron transport protein A